MRGVEQNPKAKQIGFVKQIVKQTKREGSKSAKTKWQRRDSNSRPRAYEGRIKARIKVIAKTLRKTS